MSVSPYIQRLVEKERRERTTPRDTTLERVIEWHQKRIGELTSALTGMGDIANARQVKAANAKQMHEITLTYLKRLPTHE